MTVTLEPEAEAKLREMADREGQDAQTLAQVWLAESMARHEREFEENVRALQEGLDAVDQGRVRPYKEYLEEHRRRYPNFVPGIEIPVWEALPTVQGTGNQ